LRAEREFLLLYETIRHVVALHAIFFGKAFLALDGSAEQVIQEGVVRRVVTVDGDVVGRMMPVMKSGVTITYFNGPARRWPTLFLSIVVRFA
jgi:hypothetical protein